MTKLNNPLVLFLICLTIFTCNKHKTDVTKSDIENSLPKSRLLPPKIIPANFDSLPKFTPGENGVPLPLIVKLGNPKIHQLYDLPITPGISYLPQTEEERSAGKKPDMSKKPQIIKVDKKKLPVFTIGKNGIKAPLVYSIGLTNDSKSTRKRYTIQHGDTIYPPVAKIYPTPKSTKALSPRFRDNATRNLQYLGATEGLSNMIWSILEDSWGNLWFATFDGAIRYDGHSYTKYTAREGLYNDWVSSIFEDRSGKLWFLHALAKGGVSCFDGQSFTHYSTKQGLCSNEVNSMIQDKKGNLWFATSNGLSCFDGKSFTNYTTKQGLCHNHTFEVFEDKKGELWIGGMKGVSNFDGKSFTNYMPKTGIYKANSIIEDRNGRLWFAGFGTALCCFDGHTITYYTKLQGLCSNNILLNNNLLEDKNGNIWVGTDNGLSCFDGKNFTHLTTKQGLPIDIITSIFEDKSGNLWIGTRGEGPVCYTPGSFNYFTDEILPHKTVRAACENKIGNIWFGTWGGGVSCFDGKSFANYDLEKILPEPGHNDVRAIIMDQKGNLWFGTKNGLNCFDGKNLIHYDEKNGLSDFEIVHLFEDHNGNIWIGTWDGGLNCWDGKSFTNFSSIKEIGTESVCAFCEDKDGKLWIGSGGGGMSAYDDKKFINYNTGQGLCSNLIGLIIKDRKGNRIIAAKGGLCAYNGESFKSYTLETGLISSITEDKNGDFWIGTTNGLHYLHPGNYFSNGQNKLNAGNDEAISYSFGSMDGLKGLIIFQNSIYLDSKNRLWSGTNDVLTMLDLNKFKLQESVPRIHLNTIEIKENTIDYLALKEAGTSTRKSNTALPESFYRHPIFDSVAKFYNYPINLKLPYNLNHLTFDFSAIDWVAPHKLKYSYKLEGLDKKWSQLTAENKADYRNIPYGRHVFKVRALGAAGKWSNTFEYSFTIDPPWWHTWSARVLYIIAAVVFIGAYTKWRTSKLEQERKKLEVKVKERTHEVVKQKIEIEDKNKELHQQNEEIQTINTVLNEQKELVEERNAELNAQNEEIKTQRDQLSQQNNSINESILYAKRIQTAVLPGQDYIDEILPDNFILFKPRNVVSGDFYWIKQVNHYIVIAAADCTGHGVPGAIMSMLGISFLNEIVQKREITRTNEALNDLRKQIKQALSQTGRQGEADDGMDIALCALDTKTNILQYSGANSPLYLIQNNELSEIQADRNPIGYYPNEKPSFTNHEIQLKTGDIFYLFSDGFKDQFGGEKGFKYKASNFQNVLIQNHNKPMEIQKEMLELELNTWMEGYEQTDDILVMGVRI